VEHAGEHVAVEAAELVALKYDDPPATSIASSTICFAATTARCLRPDSFANHSRRGRPRVDVGGERRDLGEQAS
jgi:hypothetical protein